MMQIYFCNAILAGKKILSLLPSAMEKYQLKIEIY